jgi:hypothetical protein
MRRRKSDNMQTDEEWLNSDPSHPNLVREIILRRGGISIRKERYKTYKELISDGIHKYKDTEAAYQENENYP